ncbi:uncharacterized protein SPSK_10967 [Sporothrix schenckii 1099-18]|uniref:Nephrocystin 3-like N-terminal domain-containing protein n=1 Tax=Sporothrix schenckii 1099-18 TaxID=1397361 RepID=A0A0F2LTZ0_SPOSC|nr:uncharacterized protein SPSK_10967 [Sporothrix schenckii 1099-18]KJR80334.1 hypothetical protein SPSK_10967 [Sporothrix schenckii 1099-18]
MDAAASVIAVVQITEQILTLCYTYAKGVKDAPADIERLKRELKDLNAVLNGAEELLKGPHKEKLSTSQKLSTSLKECTAELETLSLKLVTKSGDLHQHWFSRSRLKWPLEKEEVNKTIESLHRHRANFNTSLTINQAFERIEDDERNRILDWMSPIQYGEHHDTVRDKRTPDTCEWLIQRETFRQWEDKNTALIMWLSGSPVAGQPKLVQKQLRSLWQESRTKAQKFGMESCKTQILASINLYDRTTLVLDALDECELASRIVVMDTIKLLLSRATKPLYVFVSSRPENHIRKFFHHMPNVEIQATDNSEDIKKFVHAEVVRHPNWHDMPTELRDDIERTILTQSQGMFQWAYLQINQILGLQTQAAIRNRLGKLPIGLKSTYDEIYNQISSGDDHDKAIAERAFMWVACAIKPLSDKVLLEAVRFDPENITNPSEAVDRTGLFNLCKNFLVFDRRLNSWRFSHLSVTEYFEKYHWTLVKAHCHVAKVCLSLLIETHDNTQIVEPHDLVTSWPLHPFYEAFQFYYDENWIRHVQTQEGQAQDPGLTRLLKTFLGSPTESSQQYWQWYRRAIGIHNPGDYVWCAALDNVKPVRRTIFSICRFSMFTVLEDWWNTGDLPLSEKNNGGETALTLAAMSGHAPMCKAIVNRGVDVNQQAGEHGSALATAAFTGNVEVVQCLIDLGAIVDLQLEVGECGSALAVAAASGSYRVVRCLYDNGADVNMLLYNGQYGSALAAAAFLRRVDVMHFLVDKGAKVDMLLKCGGYGSALIASVAGFWRPKVALHQPLVDYGANVNLLPEVGRYGSPLVAAASIGSLDKLTYLVKKGAVLDQQLRCGRYGSPLCAAVAANKKKIVTYLVNQGADVNFLPKVGQLGSALAVAALLCSGECVEFLLRKGADANLRLLTGKYKTAIEAAEAMISKEDRLMWSPGLYFTGWEVDNDNVRILKLLREHVVKS